MENNNYEFFDTMSTSDFKEYLGKMKSELTENNMSFSDLMDVPSLETEEEQVEHPMSVLIFHNSMVSF